MASTDQNQVHDASQYRGAFLASLGIYRTMWGASSIPPRCSVIEYGADFERTARLCCAELGGIYPLVLDLLYLKRKKWRVVAAKSGASKRLVFYTAYRLQELVGQRLCEMRPYPLYPPSSYIRTRPVPPRAVRYMGRWFIPRNQLGEFS